MPTVIAFHGGVSMNRSPSKKVLEDIVEKFIDWQRANCNSSDLDRVANLIAMMERCSHLNAGYGSNLNTDGVVELDCLLTTSDHEGASLCGVKNTDTPILVTCALLKDSRKKKSRGLVSPKMLCGEGACRYVHEMGYERPPKSLISENAHIRHLEYLALDTVGAALVGDDICIAGCSSGGINLKVPGRVGHAAIIGSGGWAEYDKDAGIRISCVASGQGEYILQRCLSLVLCEKVIAGLKQMISIEEILKNFLDAHINIPLGFLLTISNTLLGTVECWSLHTTPNFISGVISVDGMKIRHLLSSPSSSAKINLLYLDAL